jgi:RNA polymerase sigma factor (sigma-70 family)
VAGSERASGTPGAASRGRSGTPGRSASAGGRRKPDKKAAEHVRLLEGIEQETDGAGYELAAEPASVRQADARLGEYVHRAASTRSGATLSALSAFQRAADAFPPLNASQQLEMHVVWITGQHAQEQLDRGRIGAARRQQAEREVRVGKQAMEHLCASCWRLAWVIVREQAEERFGRDRSSEMLPDLMSEANMALVEAVRTFDSSITPNFATYAARKVRDHTRAVLSRESYIKMAASWNRLKRIAVARIPEMSQELGRRPTKEELQQSLLEICLEWADRRLTPEQQELPEPQKRDLRLAKLRKQGMLSALRDLDDVLIASQGVSSLDAPVGEDGASTLGEIISDGRQDAAYEAVEQSEVSNLVARALAELPEREQMIMRYRYGFIDGENWTYDRIAVEFAVTAERIRQIERAVVARMQNPDGQFSYLTEYRDS